MGAILIYNLFAGVLSAVIIPLIAVYEEVPFDFFVVLSCVKKLAVDRVLFFLGKNPF
jgi:hypothetical protein